MSRRCLIGGDLQTSYQKMSYGCLRGDILDMSFRCIIVALSMFYLIYLKSHWAYLMSSRCPGFAYSIILMNVVSPSILV